MRRSLSVASRKASIFSNAGNSTNVLELKDGRFRRWNHSTAVRGGGGNNPDFKPGRSLIASLHSGDYTTNDGGTVKFVTPGSTRQPFITNEFTFMEFKGKVTLWTTGAQKLWNQTKTIRGRYPGILEATDRKPEDILEGK
jgi:hypothetical protein